MGMASFKPATNAGTITHTIHTDHLGGTNVVTDEGGEVAEVNDYYPYGDLRIDEQTGSFTEQRKYIGEEYDAGIGLNYLNARYYEKIAAHIRHKSIRGQEIKILSNSINKRHHVLTYFGSSRFSTPNMEKENCIYSI
jgi:hypothetical protein